MNQLLKVFIISIFVSSAITKAEARYKWSAGLRTGITLRHLNMTTEYDFKAYNRKWQNQAFITRTIGKRFELELNLNYSQKTSSGEQSDYAGYPLYYNDKEVALNLGFITRYYLLQYKKFSFYGQLGLECMEPSTRHTTTRYQPNRQPEVSSYKTKSTPYPSALLTGIGANYTLSNQLYISGQLNLKYKSGIAGIRGEDRETNWAANALIGVGYRF